MCRLTAYLLIALIFSSCEYVTGKRVNGNGHRTSREQSVGNFKGIIASGNTEIIVSPGSTHGFRIETDENLFSYLEVENNDGIIEIHPRDGYNVHSNSGLKVYATAPEFDRLEISGSGRITSRGKINSLKTLHTEVSGSGDIRLDVDAPTIEAQISGSGSATINGTTRDFKASISGSGRMHCFELKSENAEIDIAGNGNAEVFASKKLDVEVAGSGDVRYKGNPSVEQSIAGSGSVRKIAE